MCNCNNLSVIDYLPLYKRAFPLRSKRNMYHACMDEVEQVLVCDTLKKTSKLVYSCPNNAIILEDESSGSIFSIYTDASFCYIEEIVSNERMKIPLNDAGESVVEATGNLGYIFLKITLDDEEEQTSRLTLINFNEKVFTEIKNDVIVNSYRLPYIVEQNGSVLVIVEDSIVFPYENHELRNAGNSTCKNNILSTDIGNLFSNNTSLDILFNEIISCKNESEKYIQILQMQKNTMLVLTADIKQRITEISYFDFDGQRKGNTICINDMVWDIVESISGNLHIVSWKDESVSLYNADGHITAMINLNKFSLGNPDIECNRVIGIVDKKCVIFDATDYSEEESVQVRVIFDTITENFFAIRNSFVNLSECVC